MKTGSKKTEKHGPSSGGALNIRNVPDNLIWACHAQAALQKLPLRDFVIQALNDATKQTQQLMT